MHAHEVMNDRYDWWKFSDGERGKRRKFRPSKLILFSTSCFDSTIPQLLWKTGRLSVGSGDYVPLPSHPVCDVGMSGLYHSVLTQESTPRTDRCVSLTRIKVALRNTSPPRSSLISGIIQVCCSVGNGHRSNP